MPRHYRNVVTVNYETPAPPELHWTVWGLIAGEQLPPQGRSLRFGCMTIGSIADFMSAGERFALKPPEVTIQEVTIQEGSSPPHPYGFLRQALVALSTRWAFNIRVDAEDIDNAYAKATDYLADVLLALNALTTGQPYRAYLTSVTSPGGVTQAASSIVGEFRYSTVDLGDESARIAEGWFKTLRSHPKARASARAMNNGIALWDSSFGSMPMAVAALLSFFTRAGDCC